jgi:antitoxin VapB
MQSIYFLVLFIIVLRAGLPSIVFWSNWWWVVLQSGWHTAGLLCGIGWLLAAWTAGLPPPKSGARRVRLFRNSRNQAIRIPAEFEPPGDEANISREGDRLIIKPMRKKGLLALLASWAPLEDAFPEIEDALVKPEEIL